MNINPILKLKHIDHKFFFGIAGFILFLIYYPIWGATPFGDDYVYIFDNPHMRHASSPFVFFQYGTEHFKSWPLSFSIIWILNQFFGDHYYLYRLFALCIHLFNAFLVFKISKKYIKNLSFFVFLCFISNPLVVENIYWVFQIKTLLSMTFLLLSLNHLLIFNDSQKKSLYWKSFLFFILSLLSKSTAIFFPIALIKLLKHFKNKNLLLVPYFLASLILGLENIKGVATGPQETKKILNYQHDFFKQEKVSPNKDITLSDKKLHRIETIKTSTFNFDKYRVSTINYLNSIFNLEKFLLKTTLVANTLVFYLKASIGINEFSIVYPDFDLTKLKYYLGPIILFLFFVLLLFKNLIQIEILLLLLLFFLPISGYFYVPYMRFSYISDHWYYGALPFTIIYIYWLMEKKLNNRAVKLVGFTLILVCLTQTILYNFKLSDTKKYFYNALKNTQALNQQIIYEYLIELEKRDQNYYVALGLSLEALKLTSSKEDLHLRNILYLSSLLKDDSLYLSYTKTYSKLLFQNGDVHGAESVLDQIPSHFWDSDFFLLKTLYQHSRRSLNKDNVQKLKTFMVK